MIGPRALAVGVDAKAITAALGGRWHGRYGLCRCPVHADRTPSLKVKEDPRKSDGVDLHCFGGCDWRDIKTELSRQGLIPKFGPAEGQVQLRRAVPKATPLAEDDDRA